MSRSTLTSILASCILAIAPPAFSQDATQKSNPQPQNQPQTPTPAQAQTQSTGQPAQTPGQPQVPGGALTSADLEQLIGPIALYPDPLLANVLAASVYPDEIQKAASFVKGGGDKNKIDAQPWEPPVKAVAKLPAVVRMLGDYPDWTTALGQAYLTQAQDLMNTVQALRKKAQASGALKTTEQQKVVVEQETIYIQPANPEVIYVPSYQPSVVYVDDDDDEWAAGLIGFSAGIVVGAVWADLACDWHHGCVGWGDTDINIDRNINTGDINVGNRVEHRGKVGQEGGAWSPNRNKQLATARPNQTQNFKQGPGGGANRAAAPTASSTMRPPTPTKRPSGQPSQRAGTPSARPAGATSARAPSAAAQPSRVPSPPPTDRAQSAFRGGSDTRATSDRGSSSRQSAQRSSGGGSRPAPSRGGGGGGGSRGGGRGGGRR